MLLALSRAPMVGLTDFSDLTQNPRSDGGQLDEIWSFVYAKAKNVPTAKNAPEVAGDVWTWTALDAESISCITISFVFIRRFALPRPWPLE